MQATHIYKRITRLIDIGTRHYYAAWVWSCTNFTTSTQYSPIQLGEKGWYYPCVFRGCKKKMQESSKQKILLPSAVHLEERLTVSQSVS